MMGRKLEEADWTKVYCTAKNIPYQGWSNLKIDVIHNGLGVEHKMLSRPSDTAIREFCGTSQMHPAATRQIRIPANLDNPNAAMQDILSQYAKLIRQRAEQVRETSPGIEPDLRTGWLLWQTSLKEFLYFEEEMLPPDPDDYVAEWKDSRGGGSRRSSRNLWVYEKETGKKRYSITTAAGAKIQPYFDVPPPNDPNVYFFRVQGEELPDGTVRIWLTQATARELERLIGDLDAKTIGSAISNAAGEPSEAIEPSTPITELAVEIRLPS